MQRDPGRIGYTLALLAVLFLSSCSTSVDVPTSIVVSPVVLTAVTNTATAQPWIPLLSASAVPSVTPVPTEGNPEFDDPAIQQQVDEVAAKFLGQGTNSALSVAIVERDPHTGQLEAMMLDYGKTSKVKGQAVTPDTVYEIGSITKVFTGILLAQQVKAGSIRLEDSLQNYLPDGIQAPSYRGDQITVDELASHRSGLPRDLGTDSIPDMYAWLNGYRLTREPGSEYEYSNTGYALLGDIVARTAGTDFNTLEYQSVSEPLGLTDTIEKLTAEQSGRLAKGYTYDGSPAQYMPDSGAMSSAGYLRSTLRDMTRFLIDNMQPDATPLSQSMEAAQQVQAEGKGPDTGTGLGWDIDHPGAANERIYKGGTTYGFTSYISLMGDGSSGFVLLTNGMYADTLVPRMLGILGTP